MQCPRKTRALLCYWDVHSHRGSWLRGVAGDMSYKGYHSYRSCLSPIHCLAAMGHSPLPSPPMLSQSHSNSAWRSQKPHTKEWDPAQKLIVSNHSSLWERSPAQQKCIRKRVWGRLSPCFLSYFFLYMFIFMTNKATEMNIIHILGLESFVYSFLSQLWMTIILHQ